MKYALDTNIISYIMRGEGGVKERWIKEESLGNFSTIPLIVYYEVKRGLLAVNATTKLNAFEKVCASLQIDDLNPQDMDIAARIYAERTKQGRPIDDADLLIAAQAISRDCTLVTNNTKHFEGIEGLSLENWVL